MPVCAPFARSGTQNDIPAARGTHTVHLLFIVLVVGVIAVWRHAPAHAAVILALPAIAAVQGFWDELMSDSPCVPAATDLVKVFTCYFPAAVWMGMWALVRLLV